MKQIPFMSDIHIHIIPGVDDGSWDMEMSLVLLKMAWVEGIRKIIATPHSSAFEQNSNSVKDIFEELKEEVKRQRIPMELYLGCEIKSRESKMDNILENLRSEKFPTLNGTNYVLTEFDTFIEPKQAIICANRLLEEEWIPVIAHVERYDNLFADFSTIEKLKELGCLFQVNVYMYNRYERDDIRKTKNAYKMMEKQMISFLGTDSHRTFYRAPSAKMELEDLYGTYDNAYLDAIVFQNAEKMLKL